MDNDPKVDRTVDRILSLLGKEYVIMGSTHVKAWRAGPFVGVSAGGFFLVFFFLQTATANFF